jgi:two-component system response regulator HydG
MDRLISYDWPGNVRELENAVERAMVINRGSLLRSTDFLLQTSLPDCPENGLSCGQKLDDVERAHIERVLKECGGNHSRAARILDIDRTTLYSRLRRYGLK